jgi:hypothetical protein
MRHGLVKGDYGRGKVVGVGMKLGGGGIGNGRVAVVAKAERSGMGNVVGVALWKGC